MLCVLFIDLRLIIAKISFVVMAENIALICIFIIKNYCDYWDTKSESIS